MELTHGGSSFGISKIIDVKIDEGGRQLYKVKWEPTWKPAENLFTCQHLIDKFWSFVNRLKKNEVARGTQKRKIVDQAPNDSIKKISAEKKADIQRLITCTDATTAGNCMPILNQSMFTPSDRFLPTGNTSSNMPISSNNQQFDKMGVSSPTHGINPNLSRSPLTPRNIKNQYSSPGQPNVNSQKSVMMGFGNKTPTSRIKTEPENKVKVLTPSTTDKSNSMTSTSTLKYIENFSHPHVKLILVCVVCNKELNPRADNYSWKRHFLTHASNEDKPYKCHICLKGFVETNKLNRHLKTHEKEITPKVEE